MLHETIKAYGHPLIKATHRTTFEITKEEYLTPRGDCIIGVGADKSVKDLSQRFKDAVRRNDSILIIVLKCGNVKDIVLAQGSSNLILSDPDKIIVRKSSYVEPATLAIRANKAARDIDRALVVCLKNGSELFVDLYVLRLDEISSPYKDVGSVVNDFSQL